MTARTGETCDLCKLQITVGYRVKDSVWWAAMPKDQHYATACLGCFTRLGDANGVEWDKKITLYPVSRVTRVGRLIKQRRLEAAPSQEGGRA